MNNNETRLRKRFTRIAVGAFILAIVVLILLDESAQPPPATSAARPAPSVSYVNVEPATHTAIVETMAEVEPRYQSAIRSLVSGEVVDLSGDFIAGNTVDKGEQLLRIENSAYLTAVAEAENRLAQAQLAYLVEEREAAQARRNWQRSGIQTAPDSPLTLHQPQLEAARAELEAAKTGLRQARVELGRTEIRAPFEGVIVERAIDPGEAIDSGQEVGIILATGILDITARLNERQWALLASDWRGAAATLLDPSTGAAWPARIRAAGKFIDPETRMRLLYLEAGLASGPADAGPLPGSYVRVRLPGKAVERVLKVPESAFTREAEIWYLDENDRLASFNTQLLFTGEGYVFVAYPGPLQDRLRVVVYPQAGFREGQKVAPQAPAAAPAGGG